MWTIYESDGGDWTEVGTLDWTGEEFSVATENDAVQRIVDRVNDSRTWDTAPPPEQSNAPVAEGDEPLDRERAESLIRTYLLENGFGLAKENELTTQP